jgi:hypothetical protein
MEVIQARINTSKANYLELLEKIMTDFKSQNGRIMLNLKHLRYEMKNDIIGMI